MSWTPECPLCRLARHDAKKNRPSFPDDLQTKCFLENETYIVVEDLDPKKFKVRYLGVYKEHVGDGEIPDVYLNGLVHVAVQTAWEQSLLHGGRIKRVDIFEHSIRDHAHVQVGVK